MPPLTCTKNRENFIQDEVHFILFSKVQDETNRLPIYWHVSNQYLTDSGSRGKTVVCRSMDHDFKTRAKRKDVDKGLKRDYMYLMAF